jgi:hypothetical protein
MRMRTLSWALAVWGTMLSAGVAQAQTANTLYFQSQPGDYIGGGQTATYTAGTFTAYSSLGHIEIAYSDPSHWWYLNFAAPQGDALATGAYEGAVRWPFQSPTHPGLDVSGDGRGCNMLSGRFSVLDVQFDGSGNVTQFAADFEQHCENATPALYGAIRFNSSLGVTPRLSVGNAAVIERAGPTSMTFVISLSQPSSGAVSVHYATADGTALAGSDYVATSGTVSFTPPQTSKQVTVQVKNDGAAQGDQYFHLQLSAASGAPIAFDQGTGTILDGDGPQSFLVLNSQSGDYIGQGQLQTLTVLDGVFRTERNYDNGIHVNFDGDTWWDLNFAAPNDATLAAGDYDGATRWPFQSPTTPGLDVSGDGRGCNTLSGRFVVLEVAYDGSGNVTQLAADFEQHCEGVTPALYGSIRIHSSVAVVPRLSIGNAAVVEASSPTAMTFVVSLSQPATGTVTVHYATADGTAVAGSDYIAASGTVTFTPPQTSKQVTVQVLNDGAAEGDQYFFVNLSAPSGAELAASQGKGTITDGDGPQTFLVLNSQPGDYIGQGQYQMLTVLDGTFSTDRTFDHGVHVHFESDTWWDLYFAAPNGAALAVGAYEGATRWPFQSPTAPGLDVSGDARGCNTLSGRFVVLEIEYDGSGNVVTLAADFEQHCEGQTPALYGSIRINSTVAASVARLSIGNAQAVEGPSPTTMTFVVSLSQPATGTVTVHYATADGTAVAGSDYVAATGMLTFTPPQTSKSIAVQVLNDGAAQGDQYFFVNLSAPSGAEIAAGEGQGTIIDGDGQQSLLVLNSQAGDYIGQGLLQTLTVVDGVFSVSRNFDNGVNVHFQGDTWWDLAFSAPGDAPLTVGTYEGATRWPFQSAGEPGLDVSGDGRGCNMLTGRFEVRQVEYDASGNVLRFAADFEQHCEGGPAALFGTIRFRSTVGPSVDVAVAFAALPQSLTPGQPVSFSFQVTNNGPDGAAAVPVHDVTSPPLVGQTWSCAGADGASCGSGSGDVSDSASLPVRGVARYTVQGTLPMSAAALLSTASADPPAGVHESNLENNAATYDSGVGYLGWTTALVLNSQPGDYIGHGSHQVYTAVDGFFGAEGGPQAIGVSFRTPDYSHRWTLDFAAQSRVVLAPGMYEGASRWPFQSPRHPGLDVSGDGAGCNTLTGRFVVLELLRDAGGRVVSFAADFEQHCEGATPALFGSIRFNSTVRVVPRVSIADVAVVEDNAEPTPATFTISLSELSGNAVTVDYATADRSAVAGTDYIPVSGSVTFAPGESSQPLVVQVLGDGVPAGDKTFQVLLTNPGGAEIAFGRAQGTILDSEAGTSSLLLNSDSGDYIGLGQLQRLTAVDGDVTASRNFDAGVSVQFQGDSLWSTDVAAAQDATLVPGAYEGAVRFPFQPPNLPGLDVSGDGRGCNMLSGRFVVLDAAYAGDGTVQSFAANFEQHCEGHAPALYGAVRYKSAPPASADLATTLTAAPGRAVVGRPVSYVFVIDNHGPDRVAGGTATFSASALADVTWSCVASGGASCGSGSGPLADPITLPIRGRLVYTIGGLVLPGSQNVTGRLCAGLPAGLLEWNESNNCAVATTPVHHSSRGDFDADGQTDLLWRNSATRALSLWFLDGVIVRENAAVERGPAGAMVVAAADFNGDHHADILWQDSRTGRLSVWYMNGARVLGKASLEPEGLGMGVAVIGAADFDGDERPDILWQSPSTGEVSVWLLDGLRLRRKVTLRSGRPGPQWQPSAAVDLDGDGKTDIVWRKPGQSVVRAWFMDRLHKVTEADLSAPDPGPAWRLAAVGDYDLDDRGDLVWLNETSGELLLWYMDGATIKATGTTTPSHNLSPSWKVVGPR